jgi:ABC-type phosphate/phosphonate transport system substrate-binding protein
MTNEIKTEKDWHELTEKLVKRQMHLGVYQGNEFAWAQARQTGLKPLALSVNVYVYSVAYVVAQSAGKIKDFAGLQGQTLAVPSAGQRFLRLFVDRKVQEAGKKAEEFFAKITAPAEIEDALDDVVDGKVQAAVADRAALEGYKRRKPGRFAKLKEVAKSGRFPPPLVAYYDGVLDKATLDRFQKGLLNASKKERGQTMLTLFRLSGFATVPADFAQVLAQTRKEYPPPPLDAK